MQTYHPSRQALQHPDPAERDRREECIRSSLRRAAELISSRPVPVDVAALDVDVVGRPATFATAGEAAWQAAVADAVGEREVPAGVRFAVEVEFRLPPARTLGEAWDLDNLVKPTLDALGGVIGWRTWNGAAQVDDERVDRLVASKRTVAEGHVPGARLRIEPLPDTG